MTIEVGLKITLDDQIKYIVMAQTKRQEGEYFLLVTEDCSDCKFCLLDGDSMIEIEDKEFNSDLLQEFFENAKSSITDLKLLEILKKVEVDKK